MILDKLKEALRAAQIILVLLPASSGVWAAETTFDMREPTGVIQAYLRATYARDFVAAYQFISSEDRRARDLNQYLRQRSPFSGFTLEVAKKLGDLVEVMPLRREDTGKRIALALKFRVPDPKKLAPLLYNWDAYRLNSLPPQQRQALINLLNEKKRDGSLPMIEGEETFELVREGSDWRIYLNWAAGVKIPLRLDLSKSSDLDVKVSRREVVLQPGEVFEIRLKIKNRAARPVTTRIGHLVEPGDLADYLEFVQCGFLSPVTIEPGKEQEYSGTYLLRASLPEGVRELSLTYDFRLLK